MRIILNADDFGRSHERNIAIDKCFKKGYISQASLMVNTPFTEEAISLMNKNNYSDKICLHINLSAGTPLTNDIKNTCYCKNGEFKPISFKQRNIHFPLIALYKEIEAQILTYFQIGGKMKHIDSHFFYHLDIPVIMVLIPLMLRYKFRSIRSVGNHRFNKSFIHKIYYGTINSVYSLFFKTTKWTSNIDFFLFTNHKKRNGNDCIELYCHPDFIDNTLIDNTISVFGHKKRTMEENIKEINKYDFINYGVLINN